MQIILHLVVLNDNNVTYGLSPILVREDKQCLGTAPGGLAGRGTTGGKDLPLPELARYRVFRLRTASGQEDDGRSAIFPCRSG